jgi:hypothetical protein
MKSYLLTLIVFFFSFVGFSQEASVSSSETLKNSVASGAISMILPDNVTSESVKKYSKYYTSYFTTSFDEASHEVTFNMIQNESKSRRVIVRFLSANGVQFVKVGETSLPVSNFYELYLK